MNKFIVKIIPRYIDIVAKYGILEIDGELWPDEYILYTENNIEHLKNCTAILEIKPSINDKNELAIAWEKLITTFAKETRLDKLVYWLNENKYVLWLDEKLTKKRMVIICVIVAILTILISI